MNFLQQFQSLFPQEHRAIAKITKRIGTGSEWQAQTALGQQPLILYGDADVGKTVYYEQRTNRILGIAPDLNIISIDI